MKKFKISFTSERAISIYSSITSALIGLLVGFIVLFIFNPSQSFNGFFQIISGGFSSITAIGISISNTAPLIMCGLAVTFAYKCGLFNIGVAGQYVLGAFGAIFGALVLHLPWFLCILLAAILAFLWGIIPGLFKAYFNVNEVITSIMLNWIGLFGINEIVLRNKIMYNPQTTSTFPVSGASKLPTLGLEKLFPNESMSIAIIIAILMAIAIHVILNKTKLGFELKACGSNKDAAKYAGISQNKNIILSMGISGCLAGIGASLYYLPNINSWEPLISSSLPATGFNGITVALVGAINPIGNIFSAFFMAFMSRGSGSINTQYFAPEMADLIFGVIVYLCAFSDFFKVRIKNFISKKFIENKKEAK